MRKFFVGIAGICAIFVISGCINTRRLNPMSDDGLTADGMGESPTDMMTTDLKIGSCVPPATQSCYTGRAGTKGVGLCKEGIQACLSPQNIWSDCIVEIKPTTEICDSQDNDCDGKTDEDPTTFCSLPNTDSSTCEKGACKVVKCKSGYWDVDKKPSDGCEYGCTVSMGGIDVCDKKDNDCDGKVDEYCNNLVLYLDGSFTGGKAVDKSGKGHNGTLYKGVTSVPGKVGKAFELNGVDQYILVKDHGDFQKMTTGFTVMAWVKADTSANTLYLFWKADDRPGIRMDLFPGQGVKWGFHVVPKGSTGYIATDLVAVGKWTHLAMTFDGNKTVKACVNGVLKGTSSTSYTAGGNILIGGDGVAGRFMKGMIDEVLVYTAALTTGEIAAYYQATSAPYWNQVVSYDFAPPGTGSFKNLGSGGTAYDGWIMPKGSIGIVAGPKSTLDAAHFKGAEWIEIKDGGALDKGKVRYEMDLYWDGATAGKGQVVLSRGQSCSSPRIWEVAINQLSIPVLNYSQDGIKPQTSSFKQKLKMGTWHHLVLTLDSGNITLSLAGETATASGSKTGQRNLRLGSGLCPSTDVNIEFLRGKIANFQAWIWK